MSNINKLIKKETNSNPILYFPIFHHLSISSTSIILLSQLFYWFSKKNKIYKTDKDIFKETGITPGKLRIAKKEIAKLSFIDVSLEGWPPKTYYKFNKKVFKKQLKIIKLKIENCKKCKKEKSKTCRIASLLKALKCNKNDLLILQNRDCRFYKIHTKITTKNTKFSSKTSKTSFLQNKDSNSCKQNSCSPNPEEETYIYKSCYKIWTDHQGKPFIRKNSKAKEFAKKFVAELFGTDRNPYFSICSDENKGLKKNKWTLSDFEQAVKNYRGDKVTLDVFIWQPSYRNRKPRSRLLESFLDSQRDKYDFKGKYSETAKFIVRFYRNQIGNPDKIHPGVFLNTAKQIDKISKKYIVNPDLLHPENQLWYKYMQYAKQEMSSNNSFIPAFISSDNFVETFVRKATKNGALIDRRKGQWH